MSNTLWREFKYRRYVAISMAKSPAKKNCALAGAILGGTGGNVVTRKLAGVVLAVCPKGKK